MLYEGTGLTFYQNGRFYAFQTMPYILGDVHTITTAFVAKNIGLDNFTIVIVSRHPDFSFQDNKGLVFVWMVMHRNLGTRFKSIEKPVALVVKTLVKVVILS
jgi:hypothetical protein